MKLQDLQQGDARYHGSTSGMETLTTRSQTNLQDLDRSSKLAVLPTTTET